MVHFQTRVWIPLESSPPAPFLSTANISSNLAGVLFYEASIFLLRSPSPEHSPLPLFHCASPWDANLITDSQPYHLKPPLTLLMHQGHVGDSKGFSFLVSSLILTYNPRQTRRTDAGGNLSETFHHLHAFLWSYLWWNCLAWQRILHWKSLARNFESLPSLIT